MKKNRESDLLSQGEPHQKESFLKHLRLEKGLSQRALAEKLGIARNHLARLESKFWKKLSLGEMLLWAQGLGIHIGELVFHFNRFSGENPFTRGCLKNQHPTLQVVPGIKITSFLNSSDSYFIGSLLIDPNKGLSEADAPRSKLLYYLILEGSLILNLASKEHLFKEGEWFTLEGFLPYTLYSSHLIKPVLALLIASPSFMRPTT